MLGILSCVSCVGSGLGSSNIRVEKVYILEVGAKESVNYSFPNQPLEEGTLAK